MNPRSTSLLLAGCLFALPALLPAQAGPAPARDATAQLRAAVERLRTEDLSPADRARLMDTLKALHAKLDAIHADEHAKEAARRGRSADDEAVRVVERARTQETSPEARQYARALRA